MDDRELVFNMTAVSCAYPSDLTDEEWALIVPLIPAAKKGGNKRTVDLRRCGQWGHV